LSPKGEFLNRLEQALDLSKSIFDKRKGIYAAISQLKYERTYKNYLTSLL